MKMVLDGELMEDKRLGISPLSRGFAYGYGVFETLRCVSGQPCFLAEHLARLSRAAAGLGLNFDGEIGKWREQVEVLLRVNGVEEGVFKIVVFEDKGSCRSAVFVRGSGSPPEPSPLRLRLSPTSRASHAFSSRHKTLNYLDVTLELDQARKHGFDECVYRNEFGFLTETSISNLFFLSEGTLRTPRIECGLLNGIARAQIIEIALATGLRVEEGSYTVQDLIQASAAFVSNSVVGALSVAAFDDGEGTCVNYHSDGCTDQLRKAFRQRERESILRSSDGD